ncbi:ABC transporter permease subunit [Betaproteobacteria bacterium LSUCC0115]|nr:ABC transporter permease subunit [Burkholderiales bacterium LSUCC0115]
MNYNWNWGIFFDLEPGATGTYLEYLIGGLGWTVAAALMSWVLALTLGVTVGILRTLGNATIERLCFFYVELFRNIPLLVQMFLWYFVLPELLPVNMGNAIKQMPPPWASLVPAVLCLGLFTSVRVAEQVRSGLGAIPRGQKMAGMAIGLTTWQVYRHVLMPVVGRIILPPLTSEFLNCIKNTSLALTIGLMELTARARAMQEFTFQVFEAFAAATLIYFVVNILVVVVSRRLESRLRIVGLIGSDSAKITAGH